MLHIILFEPQIPPNAGNIIRLCANGGFTLHLIHPLGFHFENKKFLRAHMDYQNSIQINHHDCWEDFREKMTTIKRLFAISTQGNKLYNTVGFKDNDGLVFGREDAGLPEAIFAQSDAILKIPMRKGSRSINLSNCVAILAYKWWEQQGFKL